MANAEMYEKLDDEGAWHPDEVSSNGRGCMRSKSSDRLQAGSQYVAMDAGKYLEDPAILDIGWFITQGLSSRSEKIPVRSEFSPKNEINQSLWKVLNPADRIQSLKA